MYVKMVYNVTLVSGIQHKNSSCVYILKVITKINLIIAHHHTIDPFYPFCPSRNALPLG